MIGSGSQSMLFTHRMHVYLDDVAGGGCMMALMRESSSCGSVAAEHCVRKTIGGLSFFSKHCISKLTGIYTHIQKTIHSHSFPHTTHATHTQTQIYTHTHSHKYIHLQTYTYILTTPHKLSHKHTNSSYSHTRT